MIEVLSRVKGVTFQCKQNRTKAVAPSTDQVQQNPATQHTVFANQPNHKEMRGSSLARFDLHPQRYGQSSPQGGAGSCLSFISAAPAGILLAGNESSRMVKSSTANDCLDPA